MQNDQQAAVHASDSASAELAQSHVQNMTNDILPGGSSFSPDVQTPYEVPNFTKNPLREEAQGCKSPLTGNMVAGHLKNKHNHSIATHELDELVKYCIDKKIYGRQEEVKLPAPGGPVIQMIGPPRPGIACTMSTDCPYAVRNLDTMKRHARQIHGRTPAEARYTQVSVQNLFDSVGRSTLLMQNFHPSLDVPVIPEALTHEERRPLLKVMSWDTFMVDVRRYPKEVKAVETLKGKHHNEEHHGLFKAVSALVANHFHVAGTILDGNPNKLTIAKTLLDGSNVTRQSKYWRPISKDNRAYPDMIIQLIRAIIRLHSGHGVQSAFSFDLDVTQTKALDAFISGMVHSNMSINDQNIKEFHELLWSLIDGPSFHGGRPWANVIQRFIWLRALRRDGNFYEAGDLSPDLAKLEYFVNGTSLVHALWYQRDSDMGEIERVLAVHNEVLAVGRSNTFNMLFQYQQFSSSLALNQQREPKVFFDPGFQWLEGQVSPAYNGRTAFNSMPNNLNDDMTNTIRGHSFAKDKQFDSIKLEFFCSLVQDHSLAMVDGDGRLGWNIPAVKDILRRCGEVWKPLYHLLYVTGQISTRSVQFLEHHTSNSDRHRNIFVQGQELILLSGWTFLFEFLAGGLRDAEAILAKLGYGDTAHHQYKTYLMVDNGSRIKPDQWYTEFKQRNREVFNCPWGVRAFRQGAIAMAREFISPNDAFAMAEDLLAEGADHSTDTDKEHYGILYGSMPELTNNTMSKHRWLNEEWHAFCGLGPFPPQEPIRQTRTRGAHSQGAQGGRQSSPDLAGISETVSTIASSMVTKFLQDNLPRLLKELATTAILPPILDALQQGTAALTMRQDHPVGPHKLSSVQTPARLGEVVLYGDLAQTSQSDMLLACNDTDEGSESMDMGNQGVEFKAGACGPSAYTSQSSISTFTPPAAHRKRNRVEKSPSLWTRVRSASYLSRDELDDLMLPDDDEDDVSIHRNNDPQHSLVPSSSLQRNASHSDQDQIGPPPYPSSAHANQWRMRVRSAFKLLFKDPAAKEKSREQLNAIVSVMTVKKDILVTLKTGGGKSALWMVAPLIDPDQRCIVVCPFVVLLEEQVSKCCAAGLKAHNFTKNKVVPDDVQILFLQVETCSGVAFREFLATPVGSLFNKMFLDECHDMVMCHPERKRPWELLAPYLRHFNIAVSELHEVRSCTDRPEIGFHVLQVLPTHAKGALQNLVAKLQSRMGKSDRMLVFFASNREADAFGTAMNFAVFHSELPTMGENSKADNLEKWDSGKTKVMACTTAFAQGVDRSSVRFVIINGVEYGLPVINQMAGRAGRDGKEAHTFYLTSKTDFGAFESDFDFDSLGALQNMVFGNTCRRHTSISCMDGSHFAYRCKDKPDVIPCDICDPTTQIHCFALDAIKEPWLPLTTGRILVPSSSPSTDDQGQEHITFALSQTSQASKYKLSQPRMSSASRPMCTPAQVLVPSSSPTASGISNTSKGSFSVRSLNCHPFEEMPRTIQPSKYTLSQPMTSDVSKPSVAPSFISPGACALMDG
ncbi:hypothetical protein DFJ58DRAFT_734353 [Suillus subalutaceus]|uniref:uncharacterized protein n=1 Tax=Suillus subalutaceus TaxID=48586 RepID=UPI001B85C7C2|nr:uncharacterized protein DFJ58DRAFT_734353 [Suillus subalutaceus]KAG1837461.1 hypothetical protein DFJ58DRAFT_734353 [Suillus subalutaceus]